MSEASSVHPALAVDRLHAALPDRLPGVVVEVVQEAPSTNTLVAARARTGTAEGLVVVAEHQSAGRGRLDRVWETPPRSALTFSMLLRPTAPSRSWPWLPLLAGYAVAKALKADGYEAGVKWPNDVLLGERKVAGILLERVETSTGPAAVIGVGLNVGMTDGELPVPEATSLAVASGSAPDRTDLLLAVLQTLWEAYEAWQTGGEDAEARLAESYAAACLTIGRDVQVDLPSGELLTGRAVGVDPGGRLVVQTPAGPRPVGAGDVIHVRSMPGRPDQ
jgi:BirA family biotin operon repressor/biotin-[acetyl-CoA-carboxylase] ligase